jgi:predicted phosphodiesterase
MHLQILSDLHGSKPSISKKADVLVYAGDVDTSPKKVGEYFQEVRKISSADIIYVMGNHEYYGHVYPDVEEDYWNAIKDIENIHFLERNTVDLFDVVFMGTTLWTDYDNGRGIVQAMYGMNDFEYIHKPDGKLVTANDFIDKHNLSIDFLCDELWQNRSKKTVVITHHMPSFSLISSQYKGSSLNGAFASDCDKFIEKYKPTIWIYGHTHTFKDVNLFETRCVCNPVGYRGEKTHYKQEYLVEV